MYLGYIKSVYKYINYYKILKYLVIQWLDISLY
jgi:hypothetical protein